MKAHKYQAKDIVTASENSDLIVLAVNHDDFNNLPLQDMSRVMRNKNFFDTRNFCNRHDIENKGFKYFLLGEGQN